MKISSTGKGIYFLNPNIHLKTEIRLHISYVAYVKIIDDKRIDGICMAGLSVAMNIIDRRFYKMTVQEKALLLANRCEFGLPGNNSLIPLYHCA
jgi:hypothetical protein